MKIRQVAEDLAMQNRPSQDWDIVRWDDCSKWPTQKVTFTDTWIHQYSNTPHMIRHLTCACSHFLSLFWLSISVAGHRQQQAWRYTCNKHPPSTGKRGARDKDIVTWKQVMRGLRLSSWYFRDVFQVAWWRNPISYSPNMCWFAHAVLQIRKMIQEFVCFYIAWYCMQCIALHIYIYIYAYIRTYMHTDIYAYMHITVYTYLVLLQHRST